MMTLPGRHLFLLVVSFWTVSTVHAFVMPPTKTTANIVTTTTNHCKSLLILPSTSTEQERDDNSGMDAAAAAATSKRKGAGRRRWEALNPRIKERLIKEGQERAIANKKKKEPKSDKRRRLMMYIKEKEKEKKQASRVQRPLGFDERTPMTALVANMEVTGVVISLTDFGAYVDIGTECDGLLHVSQMTRQFFVQHPREVLSPGDEVTVRIRSLNPDMKKMHLTMLTVDEQKYEEDDEDGDDDGDRISLKEVQIDDEMWGVLKRVTDYGAYVEVGAEVDGFLHFMDHPLWDSGSLPSDFMEREQRVRLWVLDVDVNKNRIKLTGNRPNHLPGPRAEIAY